MCGGSCSSQAHTFSQCNGTCRACPVRLKERGNLWGRMILFHVYLHCPTAGAALLGCHVLQEEQLVWLVAPDRERFVVPPLDEEDVALEVD